jgi:hypothetical protein
MEYEKYAQDIRESLFQEHYDGASPEKLAESIEGHQQEMASAVVRKAWESGSIGSTGFSLFGPSDADKAATAIAYYSARGSFDLRLSNRTMDARMPDSTTPLTAGGEKVKLAMRQAADHNRQWANKELEDAGIQLTHTHYGTDILEERDGKVIRSDPNGRVTYTGSDGGTYRVNATSENGNRFIERLENGDWVNIKNLPDIQERIQEEKNRRNQEFMNGLNWRQSGPEVRHIR